MTYDEAVAIAHSAENVTTSMDELLASYVKFHALVENTPDWMPNVTDTPEGGVISTFGKGKPHNWQRGLHGAIGLSTESAELLDLFKKELYGKHRALSVSHVREELGDVMFYVVLISRAFDIDLKRVIAENVVKLANRYIEKMSSHV